MNKKRERMSSKRDKKKTKVMLNKDSHTLDGEVLERVNNYVRLRQLVDATSSLWTEIKSPNVKKVTSQVALYMYVLREWILISVFLSLRLMFQTRS